MRKSIILLAIIVATMIMAVEEFFTIGLPELNPIVLTVCGVCLGLGLIYLKLSMYKTKDLLWCFTGGVFLTFFVLVGAHFVRMLSPVIDYLGATSLVMVLLVFLSALWIITVYCLAIYLFVFCFCDMRSKVEND